MLLVCLSNIFPLCRDLECLFIAELRRRLVEFNTENNLLRTIYREHASTLCLFFGIFFLANRVEMVIDYMHTGHMSYIDF